MESWNCQHHSHGKYSLTSLLDIFAVSVYVCTLLLNSKICIMSFRTFAKCCSLLDVCCSDDSQRIKYSCNCLHIELATKFLTSNENNTFWKWLMCLDMHFPGEWLRFRWLYISKVIKECVFLFWTVEFGSMFVYEREKKRETESNDRTHCTPWDTDASTFIMQHFSRFQASKSIDANQQESVPHVTRIRPRAI